MSATGRNLAGNERRADDLTARVDLDEVLRLDAEATAGPWEDEEHTPGGAQLRDALKDKP